MICEATECAALLLQIAIFGLSNGAVIALNAIGFTLVYGAVRQINFAHGDLYALTSVFTGMLIQWLGLTPGGSGLKLALGLGFVLLLAVGFGATLNAGVERLAFRPFRRSSRLAPLIATVALSFILYQIAIFWRTAARHPAADEGHPHIHFGVTQFYVPDLLPPVDLFAATGLSGAIVFTSKDLAVLLLAGVLAFALDRFLWCTRAGQAVRACADDAEMAQLCGVDLRRTVQLTFCLGGALAGAAAFTYTLYYNGVFAQNGALSGLAAFTAAVLGGIGNPRGALVGGLILGLAAAASDFFLAAHWTPVLVLLLLVVLLVVRPGGLAGDDSDREPAAVAAETPPRAARPNPWPTVALLALGALYPALDVALGLHLQLTLAGILLFALLALGLNVVLGYAGLLDLGYAAFFAIGGYTAALLAAPGTRLAEQLPRVGELLPVLGISALVAGLFGLILGAPALRVRGEYLALVTLAFGEIVPATIRHLDYWTGGSRGISAIPPLRLLGYDLGSPVAAYYVALTLVVLAAVGTQRLWSSRLGRAWGAIREDELAAESVGIDAARFKLLAFVVGAMLAGVAGAVAATAFSYVAPDQFDFTVSAMVLTMVAGGAGSVRGVVLAALLVAGYDRLGIPFLGAAIQRLGEDLGSPLLVALDLRLTSFLVFGVALYLTVWLRARPRRPRRQRHLPTHNRPIPPPSGRPTTSPLSH